MVDDKDWSDELDFGGKEVSLDDLVRSFKFLPGVVESLNCRSGVSPIRSTCESVKVLGETPPYALPDPFDNTAHFSYETRFSYRGVILADMKGDFVKTVFPTTRYGSDYDGGEKTCDVIQEKGLERGFAVVVEGNSTLDFSHISHSDLPPVLRGSYFVEVYPFLNLQVKRRRPRRTGAQYLKDKCKSSVDYIFAAALSINSAPMSVIKQYGERRKGDLLFECALHSTNSDLRRKANRFFTERADYERADALLKK